MSHTDNGFKSSALRPHPANQTGHHAACKNAVSRTRLRTFTQREIAGHHQYFPPTTTAKDDMLPGDGFGTF
jgi:hypothetical protein